MESPLHLHATLCFFSFFCGLVPAGISTCANTVVVVLYLDKTIGYVLLRLSLTANPPEWGLDYEDAHAADLHNLN